MMQLTMDRRTKILAIVFGAAVGYAALTRVVYPNWLQPLLSLDDRIAERGKVLERLESLEDRVDLARNEYKAFVARVGSFDVQSVVTDVRDRINSLIEQYGLQGASVSPGAPRSDRKTGIETIAVTVTAVGTFESAIGFFRDVAELPHLMRAGNTAMYPAKSSDRGKRKEMMHLRVPIELQVLPQHPVVGRIKLDRLPPPQSLVRHQGRDYSVIWSGHAFTEYIPPKPLVVDAGRNGSVRQGRTFKLRGSVRGGDGQYTFQWSPADALKSPTSPNTDVDTSKAFDRTYTLTVSDGAGKTASDTVQVAVTAQRSRKPPPVQKVTKAPDRRWPNRKYMQIVMVLGWTGREERTDELMVYNKKSKETSYFAVGDEFDGGELVFVHQTGGLVHRKDGEYAIYPIGANLNQEMPVNRAGDFPELQEAAERLRRTAKEAAPEGKAEANDGNAPKSGADVETVSDKRPH